MLLVDYYTWIRDSALVFKCIVDTVGNEYSPDLQEQIQNYVTSQAKLQDVSNPSGSLYDGAGLGEPKFHANLTEYTDPWGK